MQTMYAHFDGAIRQLELPHPNSYLISGVRWGAFDELLAPAYWLGQAWQHQAIGNYEFHQLGTSLVEETCACLLGGYGMPAELGLAAFARIRDEGMLECTPDSERLEHLLSQPLLIRGSLRRYRFPRQKARYLSATLLMLSNFEEPDSDLDLRNSLSRLAGVGMKTASWIVRNYRASSRVAIIDIHILRAGQHMGLFDLRWQPQRDYRRLEDKFLEFCSALSVPAAMLDSLMWDYMRRMPTQTRAFPLRAA